MVVLSSATCMSGEWRWEAQIHFVNAKCATADYFIKQNEERGDHILTEDHQKILNLTWMARSQDAVKLQAQGGRLREGRRENRLVSQQLWRCGENAAFLIHFQWDLERSCCRSRCALLLPLKFSPGQLFDRRSLRHVATPNHISQ